MFFPKSTKSRSYRAVLDSYFYQRILKLCTEKYFSHQNKYCFREKTPYQRRESSNQPLINRNTFPSSSKTNSFIEENDPNESNTANYTGTRRRAISVYDQLHEKDFWCPRCSNKMEEPRLLPCLHSVCTNCVNEFMKKDYYGNEIYTRDQISDSLIINKVITFFFLYFLQSLFETLEKTFFATI